MGESEDGEGGLQGAELGADTDYTDTDKIFPKR